VHEPARSFDEFFDEHYDAVRRSLAVAYRDPLLAEELAQDSFTRAFTNWRRVSRMERPAGWVYVVALRGGRRQRGRRAGVAPPAAVAVAADPIGSMLERDALEPLLARLPERQRIAVVLRYLADLPLADVAAAMGCKVGTAKSTLHTALARLRVEVSGMDEELV